MSTDAKIRELERAVVTDPGKLVALQREYVRVGRGLPQLVRAGQPLLQHRCPSCVFAGFSQDSQMSLTTVGSGDSRERKES